MADDPRRDLKGTAYELFMFLLSLLAIGNIVIVLLAGVVSVAGTVAILVEIAITPIFLFDFLYRLLTARSRSHYVLRRFGWADFVAVVPMLRLFRLPRVIAEHCAQFADGGLQYRFGDMPVPPHRIEQLVLAHQHARRTRQRAQHVERSRRHRDRHAVARQPRLPLVQFERMEAQQQRFVGRHGGRGTEGGDALCRRPRRIPTPDRTPRGRRAGHRVPACPHGDRGCRLARRPARSVDLSQAGH